MTQTIHRPGCAIDRSGNCLCTYLSQWDSKPALKEPSQVFVDGAWKDWAAAEQDPDFWNTMAAPMGPQGPLEIMSAAEFVKQYPHGIESGLAGPGILVMPDFTNTAGEHLTAEATFTRSPELQELHDEQLKTRYWYKEYLATRRQYWWMLGFAAFNGACLAIAVWQLVNR